MSNAQYGRDHGSREHRRIPPISLLLILIGLLALVSCGSQNGTGSQSSSGSVQAQGGKGPGTNMLTGALGEVRMIDATVGWAVSWDIAGTGSYHILRTTDGGAHWQTVLQCASTQQLGKGFVASCATDFHSASVATVLAPEYDDKTQQSQSRIFHTSNGGRTWQISVVKARYVETPAVFVDTLHGWFLGTDNFPGYDPGSTYIGKEIALFRTSDGGKTWPKIGSSPGTSQLPVTSDDAYGVVPFTASTRMQFVTPTTGWLIGTASRKDNSSYAWLSVTHNAGTTWQQVTISFPSGALALWTPRFFTEQDGLFPVLTSGPAPHYAQGTMVYITHDGGQTWADTTVPFDVTNAEFLDMHNAWTPASGADKAFYTTSDGWQHWTKGHMSTTFQRIYGFSFVSPTIGWALADNRTGFFPEPGGGIHKGDVIALLKSTDGGRTWREIAHSRV